MNLSSDATIGPLELFTYHLSREGQYLSKQKFPSRLWDLDRNLNYNWIHYIWQNRLYVLGFASAPATDLRWHVTRLAVFDITDPLNPKLISNEPFEFYYTPLTAPPATQSLADDRQVVNLIPLPGLPAYERLKITLRHNRGLEDKTFCVESSEGITQYHLDSLTDQTATFSKTAEYNFTLIQRLLGGSHYTGIQLCNGLLYRTIGFGIGDGRAVLSVFDTRGSHPMRLVGHFAAPGAQNFIPLPDGRALVSGTTLRLIGPRRPD